MKIIDAYIIKKMLYTFLFVVLILLAIIIVVDISEKMDDFAKNQVNISQIMHYYRDFAFWIAGIISPIMVFIATVFITSQMAVRTEIIAILSSGISFQRFLLPYFIASFVITTFHFALNGWVIPKANRSITDFQIKYLNKQYTYDYHNLHMQVEPNVYFYLQNYDGTIQTGYHFSLDRFENNRLINKLTAEQIVWDSTKTKWTLLNWKIKPIDSIFSTGYKATSYASLMGEKMDTTLSILPADFDAIDRNYSGMTLNELDSHIKKLRFRGASGIEAFEMERHLRYALSFTIFVLVFLGVVVSSKKSREGTGFQVALGFLLSFIFILFFTLSRAHAESGSLPAWVAAWIPNTVFTIITLGLYKIIHR